MADFYTPQANQDRKQTTISEVPQIDGVASGGGMRSQYFNFTAEESVAEGKTILLCNLPAGGVLVSEVVLFGDTGGNVKLDIGNETFKQVDSKSGVISDANADASALVDDGAIGTDTRSVSRPLQQWKAKNRIPVVATIAVGGGAIPNGKGFEGIIYYTAL